MAGEENIFREERMVKYHLLNRDTVIAEFVVDTLFDTITIVEQFVELPDWFVISTICPIGGLARWRS